MLPEDEELPETEKESAEVETESATEKEAETDKGDGGKSVDWRVEKYGEDWKNNVQYLNDTNKYLRGELDKAKKRAAPARGLDADDDPPAKPLNGKHRDDVAQDGGDDKPPTTVKELQDSLTREMRKVLDTDLTEREVKANFKSSIRAARDKYQGDEESGMPSFAELEEEFLLPMMQGKNGKTIHKLLHQLEDPGDAAYTLGLLAKFKGGFFNLMKGKGADEVLKKIDATSKEAVRIKGGKPGRTSAKLTADDIWNMPKEQFGKEIEKAAGRA